MSEDLFDEAPPDPDREVPRDPWTQIPSEPDEAFRLFLEYLAGDFRSIRDFAAAHGVSERGAVGLSARWRWRARKAAYQTHLTSRTLEAAEAHAEELGHRHAQVLQNVLDWADESIVAQRAAGKLLTPSEALRYVAKAVELQRLIAGQATARVVDLSAASDEDLEALNERLTSIEQKALAH